MQRLNLQLKIWNNFPLTLTIFDRLTKCKNYDIIFMKVIYGGNYNEKDYLQKDI